jgi:hypothetical protein
MHLLIYLMIAGQKEEAIQQALCLEMLVQAPTVQADLTDLDLNYILDEK